MRCCVAGRRGANGNRKGIIALFFGVMLLIMLGGLVIMRLYVSNLEITLSEIRSDIVAKEEEQAHLVKELANLTSPSRIYARASTDLGMTCENGVRVVRVQGGSVEPCVAEGLEGGSVDPGKANLIGLLIDTVTSKASARQ